MRRVVLVLALLLIGPTGVPAEAAEEARRVGLVRVRGEGPKLMPADRLAELGIEDPYRVELRRAGKPIPVFTHDEAAIAKGSVAFAVLDADRAHSAFVTYELWHMPKARAARPAPHAPGVTLPRELATDRYHGALPAADPAIYAPEAKAPPHWFHAILPRGKALQLTLGPLGAERGTPQALEIEVHGTWRGLATVEATWGGAALARAATPDPTSQHVLRWHVPAGLVPASAAPLVLRNVSPKPEAPPRYDVSDDRGTLFVDKLRLVGKGRRLVPWKDAPVVRIRAAAAPADPLAAAGLARHVIVATPALLGEAQRLAAHRSAHGLPSSVVPVVDIYDRYGRGDHHGQAIADFVTALHAREGVTLDYLLLAGDATYDRTDLSREVTIPARFARTMYNGATPADILYARPSAEVAGTRVGRLPFAKAATLRAYVDRLIAYETKPPVASTRTLLRFLTSPGRFGPLIDTIIENRFRRVLAGPIPPAYDVSVTYANEGSAYLWPPREFSAHVIDSLNAGGLFYTYVGHGFERGFDTLRIGATRYPILHVRDAERVAIKGTPPIVFVLACTTAMFDGLKGPGIGEALLRQPAGPIAYWGATRVCHPGYNALVGESIAGHMARSDDKPVTLGTILEEARREALDIDKPFEKRNRTMLRVAIRTIGGVRSERVAAEGALMYSLLGDPALRVALPRSTLAVEATPRAQEVAVRVRGPFRAGAQIEIRLELPRDHKPTPRHGSVKPAKAEDADKIRANHAAANDLVLASRRVQAAVDGEAEATLALPAGRAAAGLIVKARVVHADDLHVGAAVLK